LGDWFTPDVLPCHNLAQASSVPPTSALKPEKGDNTMSDPVAQGTSNDDRNLAMLAHLLGIVSGFVGALIIWLIKKDQSAFIDEQGKEALNFQITVMIAFIGSWILMFVLIGMLLMPLLLLANLVFCILAAVAVSKGEHYKYPIAIRLLK
jgi:uncharacterized Tic20 family protein